MSERESERKQDRPLTLTDALKERSELISRQRYLEREFGMKPGQRHRRGTSKTTLKGKESC